MKLSIILTEENSFHLVQILGEFQLSIQIDEGWWYYLFLIVLWQIPGDVQLSILPCWHIFERAAEYYAITRGVRLVYSSVRTFKADLIDFKPHFLIAVPRLFDSIHDGIVTKFAKESIVKRAVIELVTFVRSFSSIQLTLLLHYQDISIRAIHGQLPAFNFTFLLIHALPVLLQVIIMIILDTRRGLLQLCINASTMPYGWCAHYVSRRFPQW